MESAIPTLVQPGKLCRRLFLIPMFRDLPEDNTDPIEDNNMESEGLTNVGSRTGLEILSIGGIVLAGNKKTDCSP